MCFIMFVILKASLEKSDLLLIPIHKRKSHWCLGVCCVHNIFNCLLYLQSSGTEHLMYDSISVNRDRERYCMTCIGTTTHVPCRNTSNMT